MSANTYSWGGEGSLLRLGGEEILGSALDAGAFEKNLRMPSLLLNWRSISSSEGTEERSEESSVDMLLWKVFFGGVVGREGD